MDGRRRRFAARIREGSPLLLDGALGTEIERRGIPSSLPLWSTHALLEAPEVVDAIHREALGAGAELLTAATFRTQRRTLAHAGFRDAAEQARALTRRAVAIARAVADSDPGRPTLVAGSAPPLEDCYRPDLVPDDDVCEGEHREHARNLASAGADLIGVETFNSAREARIAAKAAAGTGLPFWVSFVCDDSGHLLSGEALADAIDSVRESGPVAVGVNCIPPPAVHPCLPTLAACGLPFLVYPNLGAPDEDGGFRSHDYSPDAFGRSARSWLDAGARAIGGCCGTKAEHLRALAAAIAASRTDTTG